MSLIGVLCWDEDKRNLPAFGARTDRPSNSKAMEKQLPKADTSATVKAVSVADYIVERLAAASS
jgi:hypothetical protein